MLVQGWILLAGTFYLSPFLCEFLAVPGCLLFVAVCIYLWFPHPQKNVTSLSFLSFHHLCSSLSLHFFPWPCSLSFRLLQLCPGTVLLEMPEACIFPLQSDSDVTHLLNALFVCSPGLCWPWLVRSECCLFAEETLVSLNSVTAPCCYSKINRRILIGFIPFLRPSYHFFRFCSLKKLKKKTSKNWLAGLHTWASPKTCSGKLLWGGFQSISLHKAGSCSTLGDDSEAEEPALPQGGKVDGWVWKWLADFYPCPAKPWSQRGAFQLSPFSSAGPQCFWRFPGSQPLIQGVQISQSFPWFRNKNLRSSFVFLHHWKPTLCSSSVLTPGAWFLGRVSTCGL